MVKQWSEKEFRNLKRIYKLGKDLINVPEPL
jgi:serine/threonine-protein kinase RIO1